jgi:tRNA1Val (adenine37-N6)-methyltransferase
MKVGTDGVLLGAWAQPPEQGKILDIGTGCGLIALMLAQKSEADITGIEIDLKAVEQARQNVRQSPWTNQIEIKHSSFQKFVTLDNQKYNLVITNPPFFISTLGAAEGNRTTARHQTELRIETIIENIEQVLDDNGSFMLIYPADRKNELMMLASVRNLYPVRILYIQSTPQLPPKRVLMEFSYKKSTPEIDSLAIETGKRHNYTEQYKNLTKDYYLAF